MPNHMPSTLRRVPVCAGLAILLALPASAADKHGWGYKGKHGPANWAKLSPKNKACAEGLSGACA